jgi:molybdopterin-guanine dinucleotide biosynthesis protein A
VGALVAGIVLTGGASRRLGTDKAGLDVGGRTLAAVVADVLAAGVDGPVIEVGPGWTGRQAVREDQPLAGPLTALAAGARALLDAGHTGPAVVVACDLPGITADLVRLLAGQPGNCVPVVAGRDQPLCARYTQAALTTATQLAATGARAMRDLLAAVSVDRMSAETWGAVVTVDAFADIDTREALARWRARPE